MKLLASADYHIKLKTKNIPDAWAKARFIQLFEKLAAIEETVDMHVVMGDFFDRAPTLEELELYYSFVATRKCTTLIFPGNHEALKRNTTFFTHLKQVTNKINTKVTVLDDYHSFDNIDIIPYNRLKEYSPANIDMHGEILLTHVRGNIPPHVKSEIDLSLLSRWRTVLAGDLHSYENSQENILYPGSPVTTSFHRKKVDTGVIIFDTETHEHEWVKLNLPQLLRKTIKAGDPMPEELPHHTIYEVEGDMTELAGMAEHGLLDKKIVKRSTDTALILEPDMSIEEEIAEYLEFVLELSEETMEKALKVYHDNTTHIEMG